MESEFKLEANTPYSHRDARLVKNYQRISNDPIQTSFHTHWFEDTFISFCSKTNKTVQNLSCNKQKGMRSVCVAAVSRLSSIML